MRIFKEISDRMVSMLVPNVKAAAGCAPDCFHQWKGSGICYVRTCCYTGACTVSCGAWSKC
ncbi:hypothetical protein ACIBHX_06425 [Nonomuraea sp. NPDC050536]|uniref:hypothetical protein n=1 Tax=Nonomuraea sp. NPDC050536 TaxID=3364366 RepID=UPI0037C6BE1E